MGYKTKTASFESIDLDAGYHATIQKLRKVDLDACSAILMGERTSRVEAREGESATEVIEQSLNNADYTTELLMRGIAAWDLDDDNDAPLPITKATVNGLSSTDTTKLVTAIRNLASGIDPQSASAGSNGASG